MANSLYLVALALLLSTTVPPHLAHVCFLHPHQRGNLDISYPGSDDCYRRTPYCGGIPAGPPTASFVAGGYVKVNLQQNLNHFWVEEPGYFQIFISNVTNPTSDPADWLLLDQWDDYAANDMVTQTNFSRRIFIPPVPCGNQCVLQVQYVSHNSDEVDPKDNVDAIFYNCADIEVVLPSSSGPQLPHLPSLSDIPSLFSSRQKGDGYSCCTPQQWQGSAVELSKLGVTSHTIYYDSVNLRVRWDRVGSLEQPNDNRTLTTITFYNPGPPFYEYLIDFELKTCSIYGADRFYPWCYGEGESRAMDYVGQYTVGSQLFNEWQNPSNGFTFTATAFGCLPDSIHHEETSLVFKEFSSLENPAVFDVPSFCANADRRHGCGGL